MTTFGLFKEEIVKMNSSNISAAISGLVFKLPCSLTLPFETFGCKYVNIHETSMVCPSCLEDAYQEGCAN